MDKKVKYKKLAERAFRQALKDEEYSHICIDSQVVSLMHNSDIERYYNTKKKFKKFINEYSPFFIEIESKKDLPILLENLKRLVMQKYNNLENEKLKPTQVAFIILLMETFGDLTMVQNNLKQRVNDFPIAAYVVAQFYIIPDIEPEVFVEFCKKLNKVF